jgi:ubiquinone/menaquinone biosynthesis C-methylase UbiE
VPDVYATIDQADEAVQRQLADVLELRAAEPQQRAMLDNYLADVELPADAQVLEIGCGTGAVTRVLAAMAPDGGAIGLDPSPVFVETARSLAGAVPNLTFQLADGRDLPFDDGVFDAIVCHTSLCHIPSPERVLTEAMRVAAPGARLAVFDGDYGTTTVACGPNDPLQSCIDAVVEALVHDRFLVRRLPSLVAAAGWQVVRLKSHGYVEWSEPSYMLTLVDRGADVLLDQGTIAAATADRLKDEARHRAENGTFFGHIAYASLIARA